MNIIEHRECRFFMTLEREQGHFYFFLMSKHFSFEQRIGLPKKWAQNYDLNIYNIHFCHFRIHSEMLFFKIHAYRRCAVFSENLKFAINQNVLETAHLKHTTTNSVSFQLSFQNLRQNKECSIRKKHMLGASDISETHCIFPNNFRM